MMTPAERAALTLLAGCCQGITEGALTMLSRDLAPFQALVERGLASAIEQRHSNPRDLVVTRYWITPTGQKQLGA